MTDRATLEALLARVLEGEGPDRELDGEIEACLTGRVTHPRDPGWTFEPQDVEWKLARLADSPFISRASRPAPFYTASLDAALTLVPNGYWWQISSGKRRHYDPQAGAELFFAGGPNRGDITVSADAATPPRALIAACLKVRMEAQGE